MGGPPPGPSTRARPAEAHPAASGWPPASQNKQLPTNRQQGSPPCLLKQVEAPWVWSGEQAAVGVEGWAARATGGRRGVKMVSSALVPSKRGAPPTRTGAPSNQQRQGPATTNQQQKRSLPLICPPRMLLKSVGPRGKSANGACWGWRGVGVLRGHFFLASKSRLRGVWTRNAWGRRHGQMSVLSSGMGAGVEAFLLWRQTDRHFAPWHRFPRH